MWDRLSCGMVWVTGIVHCDEIAPAPAVWMYATECRIQENIIPLRGTHEGGSAPVACARAPWAPFAGSLCCSAAHRKSIPLRGWGMAPYAGLPAAGRVCAPPLRLRPAQLRSPFPPRPPGRKTEEQPEPLRAGNAHIPGNASRGALTPISLMLAQVPVGTSVRIPASLRLSGGAR